MGKKKVCANAEDAGPAPELRRSTRQSCSKPQPETVKSAKVKQEKVKAPPRKKPKVTENAKAEDSEEEEGPVKDEVPAAENGDKKSGVQPAADGKKDDDDNENTGDEKQDGK